MDKTQRNSHSRCKHRAEQKLHQTRSAQLRLWGSLPGIPNSRSVCKRPKEKPSERGLVSPPVVVPRPAAAPETSHDATLKRPKLSCCRTRVRSSQTRPLERHSIPCTQLRMLCTQCKLL